VDACGLLKEAMPFYAGGARGRLVESMFYWTVYRSREGPVEL
jgi:hypothetical protein